MSNYLPRRQWLVPGLLVLVALFSACGGDTSTGSTPQPVQPTPTAAQPTPTPIPHYKVGQVAKVAQWEVTVNSLKTTDGSSGTLVISTDPDKQFLLVNVTLKNTGSASLQVSSSDFSLKQSDGTIAQNSSSFVSSTLGSPSPDGSVASGDKIRGDLTFTPLKSEKSLTLAFKDATWDLTV